MPSAGSLVGSSAAVWVRAPAVRHPARHGAAVRARAVQGRAADDRVGEAQAEVLDAVVVAAAAAVDSNYGFLQKTHERHVAWQSSQFSDEFHNY